MTFGGGGIGARRVADWYLSPPLEGNIRYPDEIWNADPPVEHRDELDAYTSRENHGSNLKLKSKFASIEGNLTEMIGMM